MNIEERIGELERRLLMEALRKHGNNKTVTARALRIMLEGLTRSSIRSVCGTPSLHTVDPVFALVGSETIAQPAASVILSR